MRVFDFNSFLRPGEIADVPLLPARAVLALRLFVMCGRAGRDPLADLAVRLGSVPAAVALIDFARTASAAWPEPLAVMRPCCRLMSVDESLIAATIGAAAHADRAAFDDLLADMMPEDRRDALFIAALEFAGAQRAYLRN